MAAEVKITDINFFATIKISSSNTTTSTTFTTTSTTPKTMIFQTMPAKDNLKSWKIIIGILTITIFVLIAIYQYKWIVEGSV